jgi:hypothetical protein
VRKRRASLFGLWADTLTLGLEAQMVIGLRLATVAAGGPKAQAECRRMVSEKMLAALEAQGHVLTGLLTGAGGSTHRKVLGTYRRRVRANRKRLTKRNRRPWADVS